MKCTDPLMASAMPKRPASHFKRAALDFKMPASNLLRLTLHFHLLLLLSAGSRLL